MKEPGKRKRNEILRMQLENERSSFLPSWRDCNDFIAPTRARFQVTDRNRGDRRNRNIIDSTATLALRTMVSGMMSGITSPARPWFRLSTGDDGLNEFEPVKKWLYDVTQRMVTVFIRSNLYQVLPMLYKDMGTFGTAAMSLEEDFKKTIRCYSFPVGSYCIATNDQLTVDVFQREFSMTVRQIIQRFGMNGGKQVNWKNISLHVRNLWERGEGETWIDVCQTIRPNMDYDPRGMMSNQKMFSSQYYEKGTAGNSNYLGGSADSDDILLSDKGYDLFPVLAPRWGLTGEDVYATDWPALDALGDTKQLQTGEKRSLAAVDKMVNPAMVAPTALKNQPVTLLPGGVTYVDSREGMQGFRPAHEVNFDISKLEAKQEQVRQRIKRSFFEDIFLTITELDRRDITATEIVERREEKFLVLGPVLQQLNQDVLDPLIDNTFAIMARQGQLPPPPQELQGMPLKVEYISIMAQAMKLVGVTNLERFMNFGVQLATVKPDAMDKINTDQALDVYGEMTGVAPGVVRSDEDVDAIRQQRQQAIEAQNRAMVAKDASTAAKNLSQADMGADNALSRITEGLQAN